MKKDIGKVWSLTILIGITTLIMFTFYGKVLMSPNQYLMSSDGDGVKNYYTFLYHVQHDSSNTHFSGMNYPHGDLHIFTDGSHPLSVFLKQFSESSLVKGNEVAWLNLFTLLAVFPCVIFIWLILDRLKIANWFAVIAAISIAFLAPQWFRISGHFSLSLLYALPITIYLLMLFLQGKAKILWLILFSAIYFLFLLFTHIYLGVLCIFFFLITGILYYLFSRNKGQVKSRFIGTMIGGLLPVASFAAYLFFFDSVTDRPGNPGGVMHYISTLKSVLFPVVGPVNNFAVSIFDLSGRPWEGLSYIGILSVLVIGFVGIIYIISLFKSRFVANLKPPIPSFLVVALLSGFILLLLSFGVFHKILGDHLSILLGPFRQIRGLGRFAWAFYFPCLIFVFYCLHFWISQLSGFRSQLFAGLVVLFVFAVDWWPYQKYISEGRAQTVNYLNSGEIPISGDQKWNSLYNLFKQIDTSEYQAIMPLPFYVVGGEYYNAHIEEGVLSSSVALSSWSGLPLMSSAMSRTSQKQVKDRLQLTINPIYRKKDQSSLFNDKDILILLSKEIEVRAYSHWILEASQPIFENRHFDLRAMSPDRFFEHKQLMSFSQENNNILALDMNSEEKPFENQDSVIYWETYANEECDTISLPPGGAFIGKPRGYHKVVKFESGTFLEDTSYTVSFWFYNAYPEKKEFFLIEEMAPDGIVSGWRDILGLDNTPFIWGDWSVIEKEFRVQNSESSINLVVSNFSSEYPLIIDNILVRKSGRDVIKEIPESTTLLNNLPLSREIKVEPDSLILLGN